MMEKRGVEPSDLRDSRELELRQVRVRIRELTLQHEKTAAQSGELDELSSRADMLEAAIRADE